MYEAIGTASSVASTFHQRESNLLTNRESNLLLYDRTWANEIEPDHIWCIELLTIS